MNTLPAHLRSALRAAIALGAAAMPLLAQAQAQVDIFGKQIIQDYRAPARHLPATILGIVNFVLILVGVLALAYLVYGGFRYITSRGDEQEVEAAKGILAYAVIGIVVIGVAAAVVNFVIEGLILGGR